MVVANASDLNDLYGENLSSYITPTNLIQPLVTKQPDFIPHTIPHRVTTGDGDQPTPPYL
jgi:hypothetical protein